MAKYVIYINEIKHGSVQQTKAQATKYKNFLAKKLKIAKSKITMKKLNPPKYKMGQRFYSYQNPTVKRAINKIRPSDDPVYAHSYILALRDKDGYSYSSKWMGEGTLSKTKLR